MESFSPWIAGGAAVAILSLSVYLIVMLVSSAGTQARDNAVHIRQLEKQMDSDNRWCEFRINTMIRACQTAVPSIEIPAAVWRRDLFEGVKTDAVQRASEGVPVRRRRLTHRDNS